MKPQTHWGEDRKDSVCGAKRSGFMLNTVGNYGVCLCLRIYDKISVYLCMDIPQILKTQHDHNVTHH